METRKIEEVLKYHKKVFMLGGGEKDGLAICQKPKRAKMTRRFVPPCACFGEITPNISVLAVDGNIHTFTFSFTVIFVEGQSQG